MPREISTAAPLVPARPTLAALARAACRCHACPLWKNATQTVFGEGSAHSRVMMIGEQPGNAEDLAGRPFVGPAGRVLDQGLARAGIDRSTVYVTNAVKHFKNELRGKLRIHKKPSGGEIQACRPWLEAEIDVIKPDVIVCLGATAAQAILGRDVRVTRDRGRVVASDVGSRVVATVHPSSILRAPDSDTRHREMDSFVDDLRVVAKLMRDLER